MPSEDRKDAELGETDDADETSKPAPPVERASAQAPKTSGSNGGRALALIPVGTALILFSLMFPRHAPPERVPLPEIQMRALEAAEQSDRARAAEAFRTPLGPDVLVLGRALRAFNTLQGQDADERQLVAARAEIDKIRPTALSAAGPEGLLGLRAVQLEAFLAEVVRFEATGQESEELWAVGGAFVRRMRSAGWCIGNRVVLDEHERRVAFKLTWNASVGVEALPQMAATLDETRALYSLYLAHPHAPEARRAAFEAARKVTTDPNACAALALRERQATEEWRLEKIKKLGAIDPTYPTKFAEGIAEYRAGRFPRSATAFHEWIDGHPNGPWSLRAKNHLKAAATGDLP